MPIVLIYVFHPDMRHHPKRSFLPPKCWTIGDAEHHDGDADVHDDDPEHEEGEEEELTDDEMEEEQDWPPGPVPTAMD